jgi:SET domain-containing protein
MQEKTIPHLTGVPYIPYLEFENFPLYRKILKKTARLHRKHSIGRDRLWLSAYFQKELLSNRFPPVSLRWVDDEMGWGVFAEKDFAVMEFIAEYSGIVRGRRKGDNQNSYCFEYLIMPEEPTDYLIDAETQGGISRYINHSGSPNLSSSMISCNGVSHIILYTNKSIQRGEQLFYDYGPDYWKKRKQPR